MLSDAFAGLQKLMLPDRWQALALTALRDGKDVIVDAPTGAGKTYIFERWAEQANFAKRALFTVPTRALANDKFAEWRARDWDVGIMTGDLCVNPEAPVVVATLEAVQGHIGSAGVPPASGTVPRREARAPGNTAPFHLLVIDEYHWIADPHRGNHYEGVLLSAPPGLQLLLLSGAVANPSEVAAWLRRLGRHVDVVQHRERPVQLEEVDVDELTHGLPRCIEGFWAKRVAGALREGFGPVLVFAPHRADAERLARQFARELPLADPLTLTPEQEQLCGPALAKLLSRRVAYHHSGLSYAQRAGLIEPLAKAGQLRAVVATLGLSAGINFSLRSVLITASSYRHNRLDREIAPHDLLQMIGRAGRRGLDEFGYVLISSSTPRMRRAEQLRLKRAASLPWAFFLRQLRAGRDAAELARTESTRFFNDAPISLGLAAPGSDAGIMRARERERADSSATDSHTRDDSSPTPSPAPAHARAESGDRDHTRLRGCERERADSDANSSGSPDGPSDRPVPSARAEAGDRGQTRLRGCERERADSDANASGSPDGPSDRPVPSARAEAGDRGHARLRGCERERADSDAFPSAPAIRPLLPCGELTDTGRARLVRRERNPSPHCPACPHRPECLALSPAPTLLWQWQRTGVLDRNLRLTVRGEIVSFFLGPEGLALAAALEDRRYPLDDLLFDAANLFAGDRFAGTNPRRLGRLAAACERAYRRLTIEGWLHEGVPLQYGSGASEAVRALVAERARTREVIDEIAGLAASGAVAGRGDIDRLLTEWRSLLRQAANAGPLTGDGAPMTGRDHFIAERWDNFRALARDTLRDARNDTLPALPPLTADQRRAVNHSILRNPRPAPPARPLPAAAAGK